MLSFRYAITPCRFTSCCCHALRAADAFIIFFSFRCHYARYAAASRLLLPIFCRRHLLPDAALMPPLSRRRCFVVAARRRHTTGTAPPASYFISLPPPAGG